MKILWTIETEPEDTPVRGNAMASGDPEFDREVEDSIINQLRRGNEWAWCTVKVTGFYLGLSASEYLGCCSYRDEEEFAGGAYYADMQNEITDRIHEQVNRIIKEGAL